MTTTETDSVAKQFSPFVPRLMKIVEKRRETEDIYTYLLDFTDEESDKTLCFTPGQFGIFSAFGAGEAAFCLASSAAEPLPLQVTFRRIGRVTRALVDMEEGEIVGFRGPYGNGFPLDSWCGKNLLIVAGGIGLPPLRSVLWTCLSRRSDYKQILLVYGARSVDARVCVPDIESWRERDDVEVIETVDPGGENEGWTGKVGFVPEILKELDVSGGDWVSAICGPPIMIKLSNMVLHEKGLPAGSVYTTLENRMKCGFGKCGRCNVGPFYVCKDGPVFTAEQLMHLPSEY